MLSRPCYEVKTNLLAIGSHGRILSRSIIRLVFRKKKKRLLCKCKAGGRELRKGCRSDCGEINSNADRKSLEKNQQNLVWWVTSGQKAECQEPYPVFQLGSLGGGWCL